MTDDPWTPDGSALRVDPEHGHVTVCDPSTRCTTVREAIPENGAFVVGSSVDND